MELRLLLLSATCILSAAAIAAEVRTARDPDADLRKFQTYTFVRADPKDKGLIADKRVEERLQRMVGRQLMNRGYTPAAPRQEAQLGINISGHVEPKQKVFVTGRPGPYDYNWGRTEIGGYTTHEYREGTIFVDVVDLAKSELVWRAHITEAFTAGYSDENWKKADKAIAAAFKDFPTRIKPKQAP
jgi:hypothetical protein